MAKEGASLEFFGDIKVFLNAPKFMQNLLVIDFVSTTYPRILAINDSYSGRDMTFGQFGNVLYNFKDLMILPLGSQH